MCSSITIKDRCTLACFPVTLTLKVNFKVKCQMKYYMYFLYKNNCKYMSENKCFKDDLLGKRLKVNRPNESACTNSIIVTVCVPSPVSEIFAFFMLFSNFDL